MFIVYKWISILQWRMNYNFRLANWFDCCMNMMMDGYVPFALAVEHLLTHLRPFAFDLIVLSKV